jgi:hypothetical protein
MLAEGTKPSFITDGLRCAIDAITVMIKIMADMERGELRFVMNGMILKHSKSGQLITDTKTIYQ